MPGVLQTTAVTDWSRWRNVVCVLETLKRCAVLSFRSIPESESYHRSRYVNSLYFDSLAICVVVETWLPDAVLAAHLHIN